MELDQVGATTGSNADGNHNTPPCITPPVADEVVRTLIVPEVGMAFESGKKAFDMYNTYAVQVGFSIRKSHSKLRADGTLRKKYLVCSNQGQRETKSSKDTTRIGCDARVLEGSSNP